MINWFNSKRRKKESKSRKYSAPHVSILSNGSVYIPSQVVHEYNITDRQFAIGLDNDALILTTKKELVSNKDLVFNLTKTKFFALRSKVIKELKREKSKKYHATVTDNHNTNEIEIRVYLNEEYDGEY